MSPVFAHGTLRLYLLSLLAEQPRHGYELITALSERFGGTYSPSAGTIYPRLAKLEEEGLVTKQTDGRKSIYSITEAGRAELASREPELDAIEDELTDSVRRLADEVRMGVNEAMKSLRADLASAKREAKRGASTVNAASFQQASSRAMHDADVVLNQFRQEIRTDLRLQSARGVVPEESVSLLRERLAQVRADLLSSFAERR
ncbi:MAG: PadR family transcriptional regulator [Leifsonia sp.]